MTTLPLKALKHDPWNPRKNRSPEEIADMAAMIGERGERMHTPLIVRPNGKPGTYFVSAGGTRLEALWLRQSAGFLDDMHPVPVIERADLVTEQAVRDLALIDNVARNDLHPVDEYEAFAELVAAGKTEDQILRDYNVERKRLDQILALGRLAPEIRKDWRAGKLIGRHQDQQDVFEIVQAFTLTEDQDQQTAIYKRLKKGGRLWPSTVREAIVGKAGNYTRYMKLVGIEAYEAAGGKVVRDLFAETDEDAAAGISDEKLLVKLAEEKIEAKIAKLKAEGFAWVERREEVAEPWKYKKTYAKTKEAKAKCGCFVSLSYQGQIETERGMMKPGEKAPKKSAKGKAADAKKKAKAKANDGPPRISNALYLTLTEVRTRALQDVVAVDPLLALRLFVATFEARSLPDWYGQDTGPSTIRHQGWKRPVTDEAQDDDAEPADLPRGQLFANAFAATADATKDQLFKRFAELMARSIDVTKRHYPTEDTERDAGLDLLMAACEEKKLNAAILAAFDAEDYFSRVGKAGGVRAIAECGALDATETASWAKKKGAEITEKATKIAADEKWLPPELRHARYHGPGAKETPIEKAISDAPKKPRTRKKG